MDEKVKLIPSQVIQLRNNIEKIRKYCRSLIDNMTIENMEITKEQLQKCDDEADKLNELINNSIIITEYNENNIDIGTKFVATINFDGKCETTEYVLLDIYEGHDRNSEITYVAKDSPFGNSIIGKQIGESFNYQVNDQIITGLIQDIITKEEIESKKTK